MTEHQETIPRWPLAWPMGWKRRTQGQRVNGAFSAKQIADRRVTVALATERLEVELERLGAVRPTLSTNIPLRIDGRPRSDQQPADPGAAVYFTFRGRATVLACDKYHRVGDNIAAIAAHIDALRRIERYGVGTIEQALAGYKALPADTAADWRAVFGFPAGSRPTEEQVRAKFLEMARTRHPDRGGTEEGMQQINRALEFAYSELRG